MTRSSSSSAEYAQPQRTLDPRFYLDPDIYRHEQEAIFSRTWQLACHTSRVAEPGDYVTFTVAEQSLFTIRSSDDTVRTFYNVCAHRAHELLEGTGSKKLLVCPYHAWSYKLDGSLHRAPNSDRPGFDPGEVSLTEVRTEIFLGFVFVNLDPEAATMDHTYPRVREAIVDFLPHVEKLQAIERIDVVADGNWKLAVENYNECYHCRHAHPSFSSGVVLPDSYTITPEGRSMRHRAEAAPDASYDYDAHAFANAARYSSWYLWPAFSLQVYPGGLVNTFCWRPDGVGRTPFSREWFAVDGTDPATVRRVALEDRDTTVAEDLRLVASVQRGLKSKGYRPGQLVIDPDMGLNSEHTVAALKSWVLEALSE